MRRRVRRVIHVVRDSVATVQGGGFLVIAHYPTWVEDDAVRDSIGVATAAVAQMQRDDVTGDDRSRRAVEGELAQLAVRVLLEIAEGPSVCGQEDLDGGVVAGGE